MSITDNSSPLTYKDWEKSDAGNNIVVEGWALGRAGVHTPLTTKPNKHTHARAHTHTNTHTHMHKDMRTHAYAYCDSYFNFKCKGVTPLI